MSRIKTKPNLSKTQLISILEQLAESKRNIYKEAMQNFNAPLQIDRETTQQQKVFKEINNIIYEYMADILLAAPEIRPIDWNKIITDYMSLLQRDDINKVAISKLITELVNELKNDIADFDSEQRWREINTLLKMCKKHKLNPADIVNCKTLNDTLVKNSIPEELFVKNAKKFLCIVSNKIKEAPENFGMPPIFKTIIVSFLEKMIPSIQNQLQTIFNRIYQKNDIQISSQ